MLHKESETQLSHIAWQRRRVRRHTVTERQVIGRASECNDLQKWTVRLPTFVEFPSTHNLDELECARSLCLEAGAA